jgi:hypothetical protein
MYCRKAILYLYVVYWNSKAQDKEGPAMYNIILDNGQTVQMSEDNYNLVSVWDGEADTLAIILSLVGV